MHVSILIASCTAPARTLRETRLGARVTSCRPLTSNCYLLSFDPLDPTSHIVSSRLVAFALATSPQGRSDAGQRCCAGRHTPPQDECADAIWGTIDTQLTQSSDDITTQPQQDIPKLYRAELPNSQDSIVSAASSTFSAPILPSTLSTLSNSTTTDVEITSSATSYVPSSQTQPSERAAPPSPKQPRDQDELTTPPIDAVDAPRTGGTAASPMLLDAPTLVQGSKRTASGMVKGSGSIVDGPLPATGGHKRTKSTDSGSNPRIGQVCTLQALMCNIGRLWLMHPAVIRTAAYSAFVCHGEGSERVGEEIIGRYRRRDIATRFAHIRS